MYIIVSWLSFRGRSIERFFVSFNFSQMFGKAAVKRFNDVKEVTPGASDYDVKELVKKGSNAAVVKSERFLDPKMVTPGKMLLEKRNSITKSF